MPLGRGSELSSSTPAPEGARTARALANEGNGRATSAGEFPALSDTLPPEC